MTTPNRRNLICVPEVLSKGELQMQSLFPLMQQN